MNKNDIKLVIVVLFISILGFDFYYLNRDNNPKIAVVYYDNEQVLTIDLSIIEERKYTVTGFNGEVTFKTLDGKIKVESENSPYHLCSKQGYISESYETIICLPNKIVVKIESSSDIDAEL
ncbi:MAG: NusG domain II-containing protein [Bacilli bacterium]|nr:NusG domain II-containing protein [Bacilli bacterium]